MFCVIKLDKHVLEKVCRMTFFKKSLCSFDLPVNIKELELIWREKYLEGI